MKYPVSFDKMLAECAAAGVPFAVASGRTLPSLWRIFEKWADRLIFFALDGALCTAGKVRIADHPIPPETVSLMLGSADDYTGIELCTGSKSCLLSNKPFLHESEQRRLGGEYARLEAPPDEPVYKIILFGRRGSEPGIPDGLHAVYKNETITELVRADVDKALAASELCGALGIPASKAAAFGDGENDRTLLRFAGIPVTIYGAKHDIFSLSHRHTENAAEYVRLLLRENDSAERK